MHLSEKQLLVLTVVAVVIIVLGGAAWGYYRYTTYQELQVEIKKFQDQIDERSRKAKTIDELKTLFQSETFKKEEEALAVHLPVESITGDTDFWTQLNKMRKATHPQLVLRRVEGVVERPGAADAGQSPPGVRRLVYKVEVRGNFYDILEYLSEMENSDRIVRVESFQFRTRSSGASAAEGLREAVMVDATFRLLTFEYKKVVSAPAPAPAPGARPAP